VPLDLTSQYKTQPSTAQLISVAQDYLDVHAEAAETWEIAVRNDTDGLAVGMAVKIALQNGTLIDSVVSAAEYDVLAERYTKITLGNTRRTLYKAIKSIK
jgi:hypothetical protein